MLELRPDISALRSAQAGEAMAESISDSLRTGQDVRVDFMDVEFMTPSFANSLVMMLLDRFELSEIRTRCAFVNRAETVAEAMNRAALRYQSGIRLSTQRPPVARSA